jgi:2-amino-4-hydroxy-6-hydroxymethyldihydropteridine diphosphokinase
VFPVAVALGSNLGDRRQHLLRGVARLKPFLTELRRSSIIESPAFEVDEPQPSYLNAVVVGATALEPEALLAELMAIERQEGRTRPSLRAPRTLDLDVILFGQRQIDSPTLTVPHPRFRERRFVLAPLVELAPGWIDPVTGRTAEELLERLKGAGSSLR